MRAGLVLRSWQDADAYLRAGRNPDRRALPGVETYAVRMLPHVGQDVGAIAIVYRGTSVVTYRPDGTAVLQSRGWRTRTTLARMNQYGPVPVFQHRHEWYVQGATFDERIDYHDGMRVGAFLGGEPVIVEGTHGT